MKVLVVVDMQNDFIDGTLGTKEAVAIVAKVKEKINRYQKEGLPIIYTRDTHDEDYMNSREGKNLPVPHCIEGTKGWEIREELVIDQGVIINKPTFGSVELGKYIGENYPDAEVELVGLCTDICVISNALLLKAFEPEREISVDASCCAGVTPESHKNALNAMRMCQIKIEGEV